MNIVITGGRVIDPANSIDTVSSIFISEGKIKAIGRKPRGFEADREINAKGMIVCPGLVDLCARLREPGATRKGNIKSETTAAVAGGITTVCMPPDTKPVLDTPSVLELIRNRNDEAGMAKVVALGALTKGLNGEDISEMASLQKAGCVGVSDGGNPVANSLVLRRVMMYASTFDLTIFLTPQDPWLREGCAHEGEVSSRLGLPEIPESAETAAIARDVALIETRKIRAHIGRLSTARGAEVISIAQKNRLKVTADVSAHQLFLTEQDVIGFDSNYRVMPPLRSVQDRTALRKAVADGTIAAICSDHQPHDQDAKLGPFPSCEPGISGLETLLPLTLGLVRENVVDIATALTRVTSGPARILGIEAGTIAAGDTADICIFDPQKKWTLSEETMVSNGKNNPWMHKELTGQVQYTLVNGRVVFER